jgi:hypothetical protein
MRRLLLAALIGALIPAPAFAQTPDGYWDAALGLYISRDDSRQVYIIFDPDSDAAWAYEPSTSLYYIYDQAADRLIEVGYMDASGDVVETGDATVFDEMGSDPALYEATLEMLRLDSDEILRAIAEMNGPAADDTGRFDN